jgi:hypothetical protein
MSFLRNPPSPLAFGVRRLGQEKRGNNMAEQSLDARRMAKEQEGRMAASASVGFNAAKPLVELQIAMMRVFAENIERAARNYEKGFDALSNITVQQTTESKREAA